MTKHKVQAVNGIILRGMFFVTYVTCHSREIVERVKKKRRKSFLGEVSCISGCICGHVVSKLRTVIHKIT